MTEPNAELVRQMTDAWNREGKIARVAYYMAREQAMRAAGRAS